MIITNKPITTTHFNKDEEMTKEQAIDLISTNQYMKKNCTHHFNIIHKNVTSRMCTQLK